MVKNKDRWSALSMKERAALINTYVSSGIMDLAEMKRHYNSFAPGGPIETDEYGYPADITPAVVEADYPREAEVLKRADASNADMVQRLKQGSSRVTIPDWEDPKKVATHKMMSAGNYVVGNVQNINGQLFDFTDPKHGFKDPDRAAINSAIERGDYIKFDTEGDARYFAEHYKKYYNSFGPGGDTNGEEEVSFWKRLLESGQSARDARVGAIGAQQVRDLYSEGKTEEAQELARKYAKANTTGIALASGAATSSLLGDLAVTGATTTADTLIDGDINNFGKNFLYNAAADILGHGVGKAVNKVAKTIKATKVARDPNLVTDVINTIDDATLNPFATTEIPEKAFISKTNPLDDLRQKMSVKNNEGFVSSVNKAVKEGAEREQQIIRHNEFARKYNSNDGHSSLAKYEEVPYTITDEELNAATKRMLKQHNTFYRGVYDSKEIQELMKEKGISLREALKISAHRPREYGLPIWVSPSPNVSIGYGGNNPLDFRGGVARLERPYVLGKDRTKWFEEADFNLGTRLTRDNSEIYNPWIEKPSNIIGNELLAKRMTFRGWLDNTHVPSDGWFGSRKREHGGRINRFDIGGGTTSTETNTQVVEEPTSSNPYKYSTLDIPYDRTAILNRQKPFYVTDENGNFVKGADGKVIPNVLGNILNTQLQPLRGIEGKYYYSPSSPHIGDSNKGGQPTSYDAEQFLLNWYNSPATIDIIKKEARTYKTNVFQDIPYTDENGNTMMYSPTPEETVALRSRLASAVPEYKDVPMKNNTLAYYRPKSSLTEAPSLNGEIFKVVQDRDGVNMYIGPSIQYGDNESENSGSWIPLHEINHAFQHQLLPSYFRDKNLEDVALEHDELKSEQHSYLMALRAALGLNPEKRDYTKEDAQQMIEALKDVGGGSAGPNKLLKTINNDAGKLAYMLNTWAAADDPEEVKKELTLKYSKGGRILDGKTKRMYGGNNDDFRSVAKMNARKLSSKTLK